MRLVRLLAFSYPEQIVGPRGFLQKKSEELILIKLELLK